MHKIQRQRKQYYMSATSFRWEMGVTKSKRLYTFVTVSIHERCSALSVGFTTRKNIDGKS